MLDQIFAWLEERQHRWHIVHIILMTGIIITIDDPVLMAFVGIVALFALALLGLTSARRALKALIPPVHLFDIVVTLLPGAFALTLASGGLWVATNLHLPVVGLPIFAIHAALVAWIASDLATNNQEYKMEKAG